jgi:hypothetical protein
MAPVKNGMRSQLFPNPKNREWTQGNTNQKLKMRVYEKSFTHPLEDLGLIHNALKIRVDSCSFVVLISFQSYLVRRVSGSLSRKQIDPIPASLKWEA